VKIYLLPIALLAAFACDQDQRNNAPERNDAAVERQDNRGVDGNGVDRTAGNPIPRDNDVNTPGTVNDPLKNDVHDGIDNDAAKVNSPVNDPNRTDNPPFEQSEKAEDVKLTADIRKAVLAADGLSMAADNVQIITRDGVVLLRGNVQNQNEKETIQKLAQAAAGVVRVDNQLTVDDKTPN
jgi:hyperosmotically inducible periplasmic protein